LTSLAGGVMASCRCVAHLCPSSLDIHDDHKKEKKTRKL
jgi:hypothetical protein